MSSTAELLAEIDEARATLYERLRSEPPEALMRTPASGAWSVVENVRHLLYAEQKHLERQLPGKLRYSGVGLHTDGRARPAGVGSEPTDEIETVFAAWDAVHERVLGWAGSAGSAEHALDRNLRHLCSHIRTITALLEDAPAGRGSSPAG